MPTSTTCGPSSATPAAGSRPSVAWAIGLPMADAIATADDAADRDASESDARLVRGVRWRLVAWSGGSTLLVLLALGIALYVSVASSLESTGLSALDRRAQEIQSFGRGPDGPGGANSPIDFLFGGGGTFAIVIAPDGTAIGPRQISIPGGLPNTEAAVAAARTGRDVRTATITVRSRGDAAERVPVRQLTVPLDTSQGRYF